MLSVTVVFASYLITLKRNYIYAILCHLVFQPRVVQSITVKYLCRNLFTFILYPILHVALEDSLQIPLCNVGRKKYKFRIN